jgi:hypothetical protein
MSEWQQDLGEELGPRHALVGMEKLSILQHFLE